MAEDGQEKPSIRDEVASMLKYHHDYVVKRVDSERWRVSCIADECDWQVLKVYTDEPSSILFGRHQADVILEAFEVLPRVKCWCGGETKHVDDGGLVCLEDMWHDATDKHSGCEHS